jgi:hypothetical protein
LNLAKFLETFPLESTVEIVKQCLANMSHHLPHEIKYRLINSLDPKTNDIRFVDDVLIETFYHIPKSQRIVVNFMIYHLARYNQLLSFIFF